MSDKAVKVLSVLMLISVGIIVYLFTRLSKADKRSELSLSQEHEFLLGFDDAPLIVDDLFNRNWTLSIAFVRSSKDFTLELIKGPIELVDSVPATRWKLRIYLHDDETYMIEYSMDSNQGDELEEYIHSAPFDSSVLNAVNYLSIEQVGHPAAPKDRTLTFILNGVKIDGFNPNFGPNVPLLDTSDTDFSTRNTDCSIYFGGLITGS